MPALRFNHPIGRLGVTVLPPVDINQWCQRCALPTQLGALGSQFWAIFNKRRRLESFCLPLKHMLERQVGWVGRFLWGLGWNLLATLDTYQYCSFMLGKSSKLTFSSSIFFGYNPKSTASRTWFRSGGRPSKCQRFTSDSMFLEELSFV